MSKKKQRPRNAGKKHEELAPYDFIQHCTKVLKARLAAGLYRDNPGLEAAVMDFDPAIALIEIAADPANTAETRAGVSVKLMPYWHKEQSLLVKEAGGHGAPTPIIQIQIAPWASAPGARRAIEMRPVIQAETVDAEQIAHSDMNSARTPATRDRLAAAARASAETVIVEVPVSPSEPQRQIARVSQFRGVVRDEERRREAQMAQHAATSPASTPIVTSSKVF